jgi:hypothetical protein
MNKAYKDAKYIVLDRDGWTCKCGKWPIETTAHRIAQTKANLKKYGPGIIHHPFNIVAACDQCNDSYNIGNNPGKCAKLVTLINTMGNEDGDNATADFITDYLEE